MTLSSPRADRPASGPRVASMIAALDPVSDHEAITHLSLGVRYGDPLFVHGSYTVAFMRQVSIPSIARMVYRTGTGDMMKNVRRRNDHTLVFFGEMIRYGHSSERGRTVIDRMERIHSQFGITADEKLYTLGSLTFEATRILQNLGLDVFTPNEDQARYHFWRGVGEYMGLEVPGTRDAFWAWVMDYERSHLAQTEAGEKLVEQLLVDWRRWFPGRSVRLAEPALGLMMGEQLRSLYQLSEPSRWSRAIGPSLVRAYLGIQANRPHRLDRSWSDGFVDPYGGHPVDIERYGHQGAREPQRLTSP